MKTCKERIGQEFFEFKTMLKKAYDYKRAGYIERVGEDIYFTDKAERENKIDEIYDEVRTLLCTDYVEPGTFGNNKGYLRYQFSWGGPSDEVRVYDSGRAEYWFMDWYDGAKRIVGSHLVKMLESVYE